MMFSKCISAEATVHNITFLDYFLLFLRCVFVCMCLCMSIHMSISFYCSQERAANPIRLELQVGVKHLNWALGTKLGPLAKQYDL